MKMDLHIHSIYSSDCQSSPKDIIRMARKIGLGGVAITDHNDNRAFAAVKDFAAHRGIILVRGIEISTTEGHLLAFGIDRKIERGLTPQKTLALVEREGGICVIAHPFRIGTGVGREVAGKLKAEAIEIINARSPISSNNKARELARRRNMPATGSSDSHSLKTVGWAWTAFKNDISSEEEAIEAIVRGDIRAGGRGMTNTEFMKYGSGALSRWAKRGFKKI